MTRYVIARDEAEALANARLGGWSSLEKCRQDMQDPFFGKDEQPWEVQISAKRVDPKEGA